MNGVRPLALILVAITGCVALAIITPGPAGWKAFLPAGVAESATPQQSCVDDVSIQNLSVYDRGNGYVFQDPPNYADGDDIVIFYDVVNSSCREVTVTVALTGSVNGATVHDADGSSAPCTKGCTIAAGETKNENVQWDLGRHPNTTGEKVVATVTVTAPAGFVDANPDNNSATSTQSINIVNEEPDPAPDIAVKSVTASADEAVVGDSVVFTVTVQNDGDAAADTTVTLDHGADTTELDSATVSALAASDDETVTLTWDTDEAEAGKHNLRVLAQTEGDGNSDNDSKTVTVTLLEPSVDVAVKSVTASATEAVVGDMVDFTVSLENDGDVAIAPTVSLYRGDDTEALGSATATIAVGGTATVTISWDTDDAEAGTHSMRAVAAVVDDDDSTNDSATTSLTLHDPVDVELSWTSPIVSSAVSGNSVSVPFTVTNAGDNDAGEILVSLYVTEEEEPTETFSLSTLAVDESASGVLAWDTADANVGDYDILLTAATAGDTDQTNNSVSATIEIRNWLVLQSVSPQSSAVVVGAVVEFTTQVENVGPEELTDLTVGLFEPNVASSLGSATIPSITTGSTITVPIEWDTAGRDVDVLDLFVAAGADGQDPDRDDSQSVSLDLRNPIALSSAIAASTDNVAGTTVTINVKVLNESEADVTNVTVNLYVGDSEEVSGTGVIETIPAGETAETSVEWDAANVDTGEHQLNIVASIPDHNADSNDATLLSVVLRAPVMAVALTAATISRNVAAIGQTLDIVATITNHGEAPVVVPVGLYLVGSLQQTTAASTATSSVVEPGSSSEVALQWDSTGETVGTHTLKVAAELPEDTTTDDNEGLLEIELFRSAFDGTEDVDGCVEDIRVKVNDTRDLSNQERAPPNYYVGENLRTTYRVYNFSCQTDITLALTMNGPEGQTISDTAALCFSNCVVPFGGQAEGEIAWIIPTLPALSDQTIDAAISISSPGDFVDVNEANNSNASTDRINIVHPDDLVLYLGEQTGNKVSTRHALTEPEFGTVDVRLASVHALQTTLPFATDSLEVTVEVANDGPATEPAAVQFILAPQDGTEPQELSRHTMVIPAGQTQTESLEVPVTELLPGAHTVEVLLSAAIDQSPGNNAATFVITRTDPMVKIEMTDVSVSPDVLILGDDATLSLTIQNKSEIPLSLDLDLYIGDESEPTVTRTLDELTPDGQSAEQITWRVPTSAKMLGQHMLKLVASSEDFGAVAIIHSEITIHIDAEIVSISASPAETAMKGEEVTIEVEVRNTGPATVNVPITLHFPSETKNPETRSPTVRSGETKSANFVWRTRDYSVGDHTLTVTVPGQYNVTGGMTSVDLHFRLNPLTITATIVDIAANPVAPSVGESVSITVTVRNDGPIAANIPITLHFPSANKRPETKNPRVGPGETGTVTFDWFTRNYAAGAHQFLIELATAGTPFQHFTIDLLPTVENVAIIGMGTYPVHTAMVGEPVEVWIEVRNDGPVGLTVPVRLTFPSAGKRPEIRSPRVGPGETARVSFDWNTSNYDAGIHLLRAAILLDNNVTVGQTSAELRLLLTPLVIMATIVDVAVSPESPRVGEPVAITVTVRNDGRIPANIPITLHFPSGDKQPETRRPRLNPGETGTVTFDWFTRNYAAGAHQFLIELATAGTPFQHFTIDLLPTVENVAIIGMGTYPVHTAMVGEPVEVWIEVRNDGPVGLTVPVRLTFPSAGKRPEIRSPRVGPGETARVSFDWNTSNYDAGIHLLRAAILLDNNVTVGQTSAELRLLLTPLVIMATIVDVAVSPESPRVGEPVAITVTVRNDGRIPANIPITLHFPSGDKQPETRRPRIDAGATGTTSFTWRTSRYLPGIHEFAVVVASAPPATHRFTVELLPPIVDVAIVGMGSDPGETAVKGQAVQIWVNIINNGPLALNVPVQLAFPSDQKTPERKSSRIEPGEPARVEFIWKTASYDAGVHTLTATLLADYNITELDTSATIQIRLVPAQLMASIIEISWSPKSPVVGEPVSIAVAVRNNGPVAANIPVTLYFPSGDKLPETRRPRVAPGAVGSASFDWRTSRYEPGEHLFRVQIIGVVGAVRDFAIELLPPAVDFAVVDFLPPEPLRPTVKGDWVHITAVVQNLGPHAGRGVVVLLDNVNHDPMYEKSVSLEPGEFKNVEFTWKTLRYPVGEYDLLVRIDAEFDTNSNNDHSNPARVHLLTARDITVGFGNDIQPAVFGEPTGEAAMRSASIYPSEIQVTSEAQLPVDNLISPVSYSPMRVPPRPTSSKYHPARVYWLWRAAQISPWKCARFQQLTGTSQPRAVICPQAATLVR